MIDDSMSIDDMFQIVKKYGLSLWENGKTEIDGRELWQPLKQKSCGINREISWKTSFVRDHDVWLVMAKLSDEAPVHFFRQLFRIPNEEECTLTRVLQIAYNIRQLGGSKLLERDFEKKENGN